MKLISCEEIKEWNFIQTVIKIYVFYIETTML